jgi:hypothetical protein
MTYLEAEKLLDIILKVKKSKSLRERMNITEENCDAMFASIEKMFVSARGLCIKCFRPIEEHGKDGHEFAEGRN